jgi:predicted nucleotidyltransferase
MLFYLYLKKETEGFMNLPLKIQRQIEEFAKICKLEKVVLFGSRARGTNRERSDIDLAVSGSGADLFEEMLEEQADTLLTFDVVNLNEVVSDKLKSAIAREGRLLYYAS